MVPDESERAPIEGVSEAKTTDVSPAGPAGGAPSPAPARGAGDEHRYDLEPKPQRHSSGLGTVLLSAVLAVACGVGGAWAYNRFLAKGGGSAGGEKPTQAARADAAAAPTSDEDAKAREALKTEVRDLRDRLERVQLDATKRPEPPPAPDLRPLKARLDEIEKSVDKISSLSERIEKIDDRVEDLGVSVDAIKNDRAAARSSDDGKGAADDSTTRRTAARPAANPETSPQLVPDADLSKAAGLYKQKKYREANEAFTELERSNPDDARVWYYGALAGGFATRDWNGTAKRLVQKGVERERAGTPAAAKIDEAFADLTTPTGKDWLAAYRKQARR